MFASLAGGLVEGKRLWLPHTKLGEADVCGASARKSGVPSEMRGRLLGASILQKQHRRSCRPHVATYTSRGTACICGRYYFNGPKHVEGKLRFQEHSNAEQPLGKARTGI